MQFRRTFTLQTEGRSTCDISDRVAVIIAESGIRIGLCHIFLHHTSASLLLCENADPDVRVDLETFMQRTARDGDPAWLHAAEGDDDMPAHIRAMLTGNDLTIPVQEGRADLGTWQGIYAWEHRYQGHRRRITVTVSGD